ncbi:MAG: carboxypeptidase-like regulatory domain-containing protein, partial [Ginsengibacter sp.]
MNKRVCLTVMSWMIFSIAFSQNTIKVTVVDGSTNQPLQGATIEDLQNNLYAISDLRGHFTLSRPSDSVRISSIGYSPVTSAVNEQKHLIYIFPSFANLNEVIVSGNREVQKRTEVPVAIDVISKTQINDTKASRLDMLVNKVPGVFMVDLGNEQHSMSVRQPLGYSSIFLYLEDGIPIRAVGDFNHNALIEINQA